jgi:squalene synthase HpnC
MAMPKPNPIDAARDAENFPVASRLLAPGMRAAVRDFYRVARGADDVADAVGTDPPAKRARLLALDAVLAGGAAAPDDRLAQDCARLRRTAIRHAVDIAHARHLIQAFLADADGRICATWSDLMAYCRFSATPVGRFLLELHGAAEDAARASDALCTALQILNHLQDLREDRIALRRCYLPTAWLAQAGLEPDALAAPRCGPALRGVIDHALDRVDAMLDEAAALPGLADPAGLGRESAGILALARALSRRLRRRDPLAGRVELPRVEKAARFLHAALAHGRRRRGSSFALAIRLFPASARGAIAGIYALARRLDDIADGPAPAAIRLAAFAAWRQALAAPDDEEPLLAALAPWDGWLPVEEFLALIDGMEADCAAAPRMADLAALRLYCRRVAGSIGVLVLAANGLRADADIAYAIALGEALQMVNVLRDIDEDAARGRLYVPADLIRQAGLDPAEDAARLVAQPGFRTVRRSMLALARSAFAAADALAPRTGATRLIGIRLIAATYRRLLLRLERAPDEAARLGLSERCGALVAALRGAS